MALTHYEKERAAWLRDKALGRSHPDGIIRRVEKLERVVRREERSTTGVQGEIARAGGTPNALVRWIRAGGDGDRTWRSAVGYPAVGLMFLAIGPGLGLGLAAYGLWYRRLESWGRLQSWPYLLIGANLLGFGLCWALLLQPGLLALYIWVQLVVAAFRAAWLVRAWGWPVVAGIASASSSEEIVTIGLDDLDDLEEPEPEPEPISIDPLVVDETDEFDDFEPIPFDAYDPVPTKED